MSELVRLTDHDADSFPLESEIEAAVAGHLDTQGYTLHRQLDLPSGGTVDLAAIPPHNPHAEIIELKRSVAGADALCQLLDYVSEIRGWRESPFGRLDFYGVLLAPACCVGGALDLMPVRFVEYEWRTETLYWVGPERHQDGW